MVIFYFKKFILIISKYLAKCPRLNPENLHRALKCQKYFLGGGKFGDKFVLQNYTVPVHIFVVGKYTAQQFISSEGALYVILPYDYQAHPLFEHTPVLNDNFEY